MKTETIIAQLPDLPGVDNRAIESYFQPWAIDPERFQTMVNNVQQLNLGNHFAQNERFNIGNVNISGQQSNIENVAIDGGERKPYQLADGVAIIEVRGAIMKYSSSFSSGASTLRLRKQFSAAMRDDAVKSILLMIDSPGGTVAGTKDFADLIAKNRGTKKVYAFAEDLAASAAYWIGSQANEIWANNSTALVGSIGTYSVIYDFSQAAEKNGIKVHTIRAGEFKGAGVQGSEITDSQLAEFQRITNLLNQEFLKGVANGRNVTLNTVNEWADGRIHPAQQAFEMKLIDGIGTADEFFQKIVNEQKGLTMTTANSTGSQPNANAGQLNPEAAKVIQQGVATLTGAEPVAAVDPVATPQHINSLCSKADGQWKFEQTQIDGLTVSQLLANYAAFCEAKLDAAESAQTATQTANDVAAAAGANDDLGSEALGVSGNKIDAAQNGPDAFTMAIKNVMQENPNLTKGDAVRHVARTNPQAHKAYILATQTKTSNRNLAQDYFTRKENAFA